MKFLLALSVIVAVFFALAACPLPASGSVDKDGSWPTPPPPTLGKVTFSGKAQFDLTSGTSTASNVKMGVFLSHAITQPVTSYIMYEITSANQSVNLGNVALKDVDFSFTVDFANLPVTPTPGLDILSLQMWVDTNDNGWFEGTELLRSGKGQAGDPLFASGNVATIKYYSPSGNAADAYWAIGPAFTTKLIDANTSGLRLTVGSKF